MMHLFCSGELVRDPEARTTKSGNTYATALVRVDGTLVSATCFDGSLADRLLGLRKGDPLAVAGRLTVGTYQARDGETRCSMSVTVSQLMSAPARASAEAPRPRAKAKPGVGRYAAREPVTDGPDFNDPIPF